MARELGLTSSGNQPGLYTTWDDELLKDPNRRKVTLCPGNADFNKVNQSICYGAICPTNAELISADYCYADSKFELVLEHRVKPTFINLNGCPVPSNYLLIADSALGPDWDTFDLDGWTTGGQRSFFIRESALRLSRRSLRCRPADSGSRCTPASPPPLTTNFRKEEWSCWYCRPS